MAGAEVSFSSLHFVDEPAVFVGERGPGEQVGAVAKSFFQGSLAAPAPNLLVVAAEDLFRDSPTAKLRRARIVRAIEDASAAPTGRGTAQAGGLKSSTGLK